MMALRSLEDMRVRAHVSSRGARSRCGEHARATLRGVVATVREEGARALYAGFATTLSGRASLCHHILTYEIALQALNNNW